MLGSLARKHCVWPDEARVLDFGCGVHGSIAIELCEHAQHTVAVDISQAAVDSFNARCEMQGLEPDEVQAVHAEAFWSAHKWANYFDIAVASLVYHHLNDPEHTTKLLAERLNENGQLLVIDLQKQAGVNGFTPEELMAFARHAGLHNASVVKGPRIKLHRTQVPTNLLILHATRQ